MKLLFIDTRQMLQTVPADLDLPITLLGIILQLFRESLSEKKCARNNPER